MATASKKRLSTGEIKGTTCMVCRAAKVRCDRRFPCGRCTRLSKKCIPPGPCQRGKWQTEQARVRQMQHPNKRKMMKAPTCGKKTFLKIIEKASHSMRGQTVHFGALYLIRTLISKALLHNSWECFAGASHMAENIGISVKDVFFESNKKDVMSSKNIINGVQRALLEQPLPTITWADIPDAVAKASQMDPLHEPVERWTFAIQKTHGKSRFYVSPSFARDVVSTEDFVKIGDVSIWKHLFPKREWSRSRKQYAEVFSLYSREDSPPVCTQCATHILLKNKTMKKVLMRNCLYIEEGSTATMLYEFVEWKKRNELHHPLGFFSSSADARKGVTEHLEVDEMKGLDDIDLSLVDSTDLEGIPADSISESILQLLSEWS